MSFLTRRRALAPNTDFALVGVAGTAISSTNGGALSPAWGAGANRTAGNRLVFPVIGTNSNAFPATPAGWSIAVHEQATSQVSVTIFTKIAAGADAAPSISGTAGFVMSGALYEFSGNDTSSANADQSGVAQGTSSPNVATAAGADAAMGQLVFAVGGTNLTSLATETLGMSLNNGATMTGQNNNSTTAKGHYILGYGITTGNSGADTASFTFSGAPLGAAVAVASFKRP